jgi:hypothetical protein
MLKFSEEMLKIIKQPHLPEKISALYLVVSKRYANCHLRS